MLKNANVKTRNIKSPLKLIVDREIMRSKAWYSPKINLVLSPESQREFDLSKEDLEYLARRSNLFSEKDFISQNKSQVMSDQRLKENHIKSVQELHLEEDL